MASSELPDDELTRFGIVPEDEGPHPFDPSVEWWNESWFWDWIHLSAELAGHCRIGIHPNQKRAWVWFFLFRGGEWIAVEEPRLAIEALRLPELAYDGWGLRFGYQVIDPLRKGRLRFEGFGRVLSGPRSGWMLPVGVDLEFVGLGAPHSPGPANAPGHQSSTVRAARFEQPTASSGIIQVGTETHRFEGRGERDHSWGPRHWNLEWTFLILNGEDVRLQCAEARIPNVGRIGTGYVHRDRTLSVTDVQFDFEFQDESVLEPFSGRFAVRAEDGATFGGRVEVISAAEVDITHTFVPPARSIYRRALIRVYPDDGAKPLLGWTEFNYFPKKS